MRSVSRILGVFFCLFLVAAFTPETGFAADAIPRCELCSLDNTPLHHHVGSHGYFRYNSGVAQGNGEQVDFQAPGAGAKYRYGNETLSYGEISLYDTYTSNEESGAYVHAEAMINFVTSNSFDDFDLGDFEEFYLEAGNFTTALGNPKIWAGRRFFLDRYTTDINDFAFLSVGGGWADGFGIREIAAGPGKLAVIVNRSFANSASVATDEIYQTNLDVRFSDIEVNKDGKLMLWGIYSSSSSKGAVESAAGFGVGVMHKQANVFGGNNRFMIQYGQGLARAAGSTGKDASLGLVTSATVDALEDAQTFRITNQLVIEPNSSFGLISAFVYEDKESKDFDGTDQVWISAGVRPYWFITDHFRIPLEIGYDYVDNKATGTSGTLLKTTLAAEFALARGIWKRPVLRAYTTYAKWSDDFVGQIGGDTFANDDSGLTAGVQIEYWW